mmetsp:Transcript_5872/g.16462  ORF Transcript_5872/g.16462 Transcript_5872/m.16462 type:complete len:311 (+) Transcript_5872:194-1126(+)
MHPCSSAAPCLLLSTEHLLGVPKLRGHGLVFFPQPSDDVVLLGYRSPDPRLHMLHLPGLPGMQLLHVVPQPRQLVPELQQLMVFGCHLPEVELLIPAIEGAELPCPLLPPCLSLGDLALHPCDGTALGLHLLLQLPHRGLCCVQAVLRRLQRPHHRPILLGRLFSRSLHLPQRCPVPLHQRLFSLLVLNLLRLSSRSSLVFQAVHHSLYLHVAFRHQLRPQPLLALGHLLGSPLSNCRPPPFLLRLPLLPCLHHALLRLPDNLLPLLLSSGFRSLLPLVGILPGGCQQCLKPLPLSSPLPLELLHPRIGV